MDEMKYIYIHLLWTSKTAKEREREKKRTSGKMLELTFALRDLRQ